VRTSKAGGLPRLEGQPARAACFGIGQQCAHKVSPNYGLRRSRSQGFARSSGCPIVSLECRSARPKWGRSQGCIGFVPRVALSVAGFSLLQAFVCGKKRLTRRRRNPRPARPRAAEPARDKFAATCPRVGLDNSRAILCQLAACFQPAAPTARERGHGHRPRDSQAAEPALGPRAAESVPCRGRLNPPATNLPPHARVLGWIIRARFYAN